MSEKLCLFCKHWEANSDYGNGAYFYCVKDKQNEIYPYEGDKVREFFNFAKHCPDYDQVQS